MTKPAFVNNRKKLLGFLHLSEPQFQKMINAGCPGNIIGKGYDLLAICSWIYQQPERRRNPHRDKCLAVVRQVLEANQTDEKVLQAVVGKKKTRSPEPKKPAAATAAKRKQVTTPPAEKPAVIAEPRDRLELDEALEVTKVYIQRLKDQIDADAESTGRLSGDDLANWSKTLLALNEAAKKTTRHLSESRELVRITEVQDYLAGMLSTLRTILLNLPVKLAPVLENQTSGKIQKIIEEEIRIALEYARNYD